MDEDKLVYRLRSVHIRPATRYLYSEIDGVDTAVKPGARSFSGLQHGSIGKRHNQDPRHSHQWAAKANPKSLSSLTFKCNVC